MFTSYSGSYIKIVFICCHYVCVFCPLFCPCFLGVFKNTMKLGTFPAILMTYTASALLHVSKMMMMMMMHSSIQSPLL